MTLTSRLHAAWPSPLALPAPLYLGVWQIASLPFQGNHQPAHALEGTPSCWVVTAVRHAKVAVQKGLSLRHLLQASLLSTGVESPRQRQTSPIPVPHSAIRLSLFLPDANFQTFSMHCMPQWGRLDIEAECRLEASRLMNLAPEAVALDYEVQTATEGALKVQVLACDNSLIEAATGMFDQLGFRLNSLTCHSDLDAYANAWKVSPDLLNGLVHEQVAAC